MRIFQVMAIFLSGLLASSADEPKKPDQPKTPARQVELKLADQLTGDRPTSYWMEQKMNYSQAILRGLATGNLRNVAINAEQMRMLSKVEGFLRRQEPGYQDRLQAFDFASREIVRNAKAGNLEGAAMGFQQLTISCFSCHTILRAADTLIEQPAQRE